MAQDGNAVDALAIMDSGASKDSYILTGFTPASASTQTGGTAKDDSAARQLGTVAVFNNQLVTDAKGNSTGVVEKGVTSVDITAEGVASIQLGKNTDGQGRIYVKFTDDNSYELYKDSSMSQESLVATGIKGMAIKEANNSGLEGMVLDFTGTELTKHKGTYFTLAGIEGKSTTTDANGVSRDGVTYTRDVTNETNTDAFFQEDRTLITGVELGKNTDVDGKIYTKAVYDHDSGTVKVSAYKDARMRDEDLVAESEALEIGDAESMTIVLNEKRNSDKTAGTGLGIVMSTDDLTALKSLTKDTTVKGEITFNNLGARIFTEDYGSDAVLKITQDEGSIFTYYGSGGASERQVIDGADKNKSSIQLNGQDATLSINGMQVKTSGLDLSLATQDIQAHLTFNKGKVGSTTLAQVGYDDGSIFTKIGALNLKSVEAETDGKYAGLSGLLANAGHVTSETIGDFKGGMQLQLGEGSGDSNRTVVAIKSLTSENLGRVVKGGYWDGDAVYTERTLTMKDVLGSNVASLKSDPTLAMEIIDQAISDVSELRATIGAFQSNLLQTNSNNLSVTIENITKTESGIRDADMADEMTDFTKNQVLQNAAMSMMSNANANAQNVLQLLR
ncbi:MAG: flagellin [Planctomycetaceae bacterium]|nr:flagellin [Planctomycetaceae bacterium]